MRRLWSWYRARRWWARILLAVPAVLGTAAILYVGARGLQYAAARRQSVGPFMPADAHVAVRLHAAERHWPRLEATDFWKAIQRSLRDPALRKTANALLAESDLPTLTELTDPRNVDRWTMGYLTEANVLRAIGRDAAVAVRLPGPVEAARWCVATRVGFFDFLLLPFASLALSPADAAGADALEVPGTDVLLSIQGAVVVASNDPQLLAAALRRRGSTEEPRRPIEGWIAFEGSPVLMQARSELRAFPTGAMLLFADIESLSRARFALDVDGADLILDATLEGLRATSEEPAPTHALRYLPASGAGAVLLNVSGDRLWDWLQAQPDLRGAVVRLNEADFGMRIPPEIRGPMSILAGSALGEEGLAFVAGAACLQTENPAAAEEALRSVVRDLIQPFEDQVSLTATLVQGRNVWALTYRVDPFGDSNYLRPCWAAVDGALLVANNLNFLTELIETGYGSNPPFVEERFFKQASDRLDRLQIRRVLREGTVASGFLYGAALREGLDGFIPILADKLTDNDENRQKLRVELEREWQQQGRPTMGSDFVLEFNRILAERALESQDQLRRQAKAFEFFRWLGFEIAAEANGLRLKAALELK